MKSQVNPVIVGIVIAIVLIGAVFFIWKGGQGVNSGSGKLQSDLGPVENDPAKLQKGVEEF